MNPSTRAPLFTVVIPLYNKERYIRRSLHSVLAQTYADFEVVVVDDGSTDAGARAVESFQDGRIRLIRQPNGGVSAARNQGIAEARGEWIAFLDADDEYRPDFLQKIRACSEKHPEAGAIYARVKWIIGQTQLNPPQDQITEPRVLSDYLHFVVFEKGYEMNSSGLAVRRGVFDRAGKFPVGIRIGEDSDTWLRVAWTTQIAYIPEILSVYHMEAGDSNWQEQREQEPFWIGTYRQWLVEERIPKKFVKSSAAYHQKYLLEKSLRQILGGNRSIARKQLLRDVTWCSAPRKLAIKTLLYAYLPEWVMRKMKTCK